MKISKFPVLQDYQTYDEDFNFSNDFSYWLEVGKFYERRENQHRNHSRKNDDGVNPIRRGRDKRGNYRRLRLNIHESHQRYKELSFPHNDDGRGIVEIPYIFYGHQKIY